MRFKIISIIFSIIAIVFVNADSKAIQINMTDQPDKILTNAQDQKLLLRQNTSDKFVFLVDEGQSCDLRWCGRKCSEVMNTNSDFNDVEVTCFENCVCEKAKA